MKPQRQKQRCQALVFPVAPSPGNFFADALATIDCIQMEREYFLANGYITLVPVK